MIRYLTRLTIVILLAAPVWGGVNEARAQMGIEQVPLTQDMVKRFLASFPQLQSIGKKFDQGNQNADGNNPIETLSAFMSNHGARKEMQDALKAHGFADFGEWIKVAGSVALAYGYAKSGKSAAELGAQADDAIAQIRNNPDMTEEQKAQMIELLERQQGMVAQFTPLPGNLTLVKSMMGEIGAVMDSN